MSDANPLILVAESDLDVADMVGAYFRVQGYEVCNVTTGEECLHKCQNETHNLIILDVRLPDLNGYEVARRLRLERQTQNIPIIFLTEKNERSERLKGLEIGADDYITKPFDIQELRLRVRNALRRATQGSLTNPVSGLPDGALVDEKLSEILQGGNLAVLLVSLFHLAEFRDAFGFVASDDVLRAVSVMVQSVIQESRGPGDFIGHLTVTDLIALVPSAELPSLQEGIRARLENALDNFYPIKDREQLSGRANRLRVRVAGILPATSTYENVDFLKKALHEYIQEQES